MSTTARLDDELLRKLERIAAIHKRIAHDPRNFFTEAEDASAWTREGIVPPNAVEPGKPDVEIDVPIFPYLTHREGDTMFAYVVMAPTETQPEPVRRLRIWRYARGEVSSSDVAAARATLFYGAGIGILASCWFGELPETVAVGLRVGRHERGRTFDRTRILWDVQLTHHTLGTPAGVKPLLYLADGAAN